MPVEVYVPVDVYVPVAAHVPVEAYVPVEGYVPIDLSLDSYKPFFCRFLLTDKKSHVWKHGFCLFTASPIQEMCGYLFR